jgi:hypothetical protein
MSLAIVTTTNEGHILAADSMETYKNAIGDVREGSQSRMKVFQLNKLVGAAVCGLSFLENHNIEQHLNKYLRENSLDGQTVQAIAEKIYDLFIEKYNNYIKEFADKKEQELRSAGFSNVESSFELECVIVKYKDLSGRPATAQFCQPLLDMLIAGYDPDGRSSVYKVTLPDLKEQNGISKKLDHGQSGATWIGQTDVLVRVIRGWSPEIKKIKTVNELAELKRNEFISALDDQEYIINWATMTLQDAIDFSNMGIKITENIQRITDGTWQFPGSSPGVGGPVDIAVITPEKGFVWIQKKLLKIGKSTINFDEFPPVIRVE